MHAKRMARFISMTTVFAGLPILAYWLVNREGVAIHLVAFDVVLATMPMVLVASVTWRLVSPKWKLFGKVLLPPVHLRDSVRLPRPLERPHRLDTSGARSRRAHLV